MLLFLSQKWEQSRTLIITGCRIVLFFFFSLLWKICGHGDKNIQIKNINIEGENEGQRGKNYKVGGFEENMSLVINSAIYQIRPIR